MPYLRTKDNGNHFKMPLGGTVEGVASLLVNGNCLLEEAFCLNGVVLNWIFIRLFSMIIAMLSICMKLAIVRKCLTLISVGVIIGWKFRRPKYKSPWRFPSDVSCLKISQSFTMNEYSNEENKINRNLCDLEKVYRWSGPRFDRLLDVLPKYCEFEPSHSWLRLL